MNCLKSIQKYSSYADNIKDIYEKNRNMLYIQRIVLLNYTILNTSTLRRSESMVEQVFNMTLGDKKTVEKTIMDENLHYIHMIFNKDEGLPEHYSNSTVYMTVLRGILSIGLDEQEVHQYEEGSILKIPFNTKMNVKNSHDKVLELIVVKAPAPKN
jgi:quercetin dioxygenase-like cupin family protein